MVNHQNMLKVTALVAATFSCSAAHSQEQASRWGTNCISLGRDTVPQCSMNHTVSVQETGQVLFSVTVRIPIEASQQPYIDIVAPLGFYLVDGLTMTVGNVAFAKLPILRCDANGCYAGAVLSKDQLNQLKQGQAFTIMFAPKAGQATQVDVPLTGFTSAFDSINH
jgi:invasion protein IalB